MHPDINHWLLLPEYYELGACSIAAGVKNQLTRCYKLKPLKQGEWLSDLKISATHCLFLFERLVPLQDKLITLYSFFAINALNLPIYLQAV